MAQCLFTRLKATVNNADLPVLEVMQQVTLDAIAASGNGAAMTDAQKFALNHFFYQIGAVGNSSLWQKVDLLVLPFLAGDAEHSLVDYVSNQAYYTPGPYFSLAGGVIRSLPTGGNATFQKLKDVDVDTSDLSTIMLTVPLGATDTGHIYAFQNDAVEVMLGKKGSSSSIITGAYTSSSNFIYRLFKSGTTGNVNGVAMSFGQGDNEINASFILSSDDSVVAANNVPSYDSISGHITIQGANIAVSSIGMYAIVMGKAMTTEESSNVLSAITTLKNAFV